MNILIVLFFLFGLFISLFLIFNPRYSIAFQQRFYAKINWKIEPISIPKEIRNTRIMGFMLGILLISILFILHKNNFLP